jgi:hypothetical protein
MDLGRPQGRNKGHPEEDEYGTFWRGITLDSTLACEWVGQLARTKKRWP